MARKPAFRPIPLASGIAAFCLIAFLGTSLSHFQSGGTDYGRRPAFAAATAALMAIWWLTEAISIYLTALVPLVLFPLTGVFGPGLKENLRGALLPYFDPYNFLYLGGMAIGAAMQQWNLHARVALNILERLGTRPSRLLLGMLVSTAAVSLWISNTATAAMMLPIGLALISQIELQGGGGRRELFGGALMLAIAYGANVGGMGTKIGTPPNLIFTGAASRDFGRDISFLEFLGIGLPFVVAFIPVVWWALWLSGRRDAPNLDVGRDVIRGQIKALGPMSRGEWIVFVVFLGTAGLWIASQPIYSALRPVFQDLNVKLQAKHVEGGIAILAMIALMASPTGRSPRGTRALNFGQLRKIPWETLLLLGGSFALAEGIEASGLSRWMATQIEPLQTWPVVLHFLGVCLITVYFGAIASNVATTAVMVIVLKSSGMPDALPLMAAATLAASCDFMLPAGTPPNALVFGSGYLTIPRMAKIGFFLDLAAAVLVALWGCTGVKWILNS